MAHNAAAEIFKTYRVRLLRFIRSRTRLVEDAEDILQDVFYQFERINALAQPIEQTAAWLYRAARNKIARTRVKNAVKAVRAAVLSKDKTGAESLLSTAASVLSKAAGKKAIHRRKAARKLSRLTKAVNAVSA